jgi:hypothetical protein
MVWPTIKNSTHKLSQWGLLIVAGLCGCQVNQTKVHHVLIAYPERWNEGDRRPCFLGPAGGQTVSRAFGQPDVPQLDCDRFVQGEVIHRTPPERIFALDVEFTGDFAGAVKSRGANADNETAWTCQRRGDAVRCAP